MTSEGNHSGSHQRLLMVDSALEKQIDARFRETMTAIASNSAILDFFVSSALRLYHTYNNRLTPWCMQPNKKY